MDPHFSIIIPHYNIPNLLIRCIKSIPVSEDIQVIVVDDNSPEAATYIDKYPELSRPYLEFIRTTKGGGAGYARNVGMKHAKGKWLLFADADDLFAGDMYDIIKSYVDSEADLVFFKIVCVSSDDLSHLLPNKIYYNDYVDKYIKTGDERFVRLNYVVPYGKLYRRVFVEHSGFQFDEVPYSNDMYFSICAGWYAQKLEATNAVLYIHTKRVGSLTDTFCTKPGELAVRTEVSFRVMKLLKELEIDFEQRIPLQWFLIKLLGKDRTLFKHYWRRVDEVYPSKFAA